MEVRRAPEPLERGRLSLVVEAHPVDDRAVLDEAVKPRLRVAALRLGRDCPDLDETEPQPKHLLGNLGVLVEARGEPDWRMKFQPGDSRAKRIRETRRIELRHKLEARDRQPVRHFGVEGEDKGPDQRVNRHANRLVPLWRSVIRAG